MFSREQKACVSGTKHSLMHTKHHRSIFNQLKLLVSDQDIFGALRRPVGIYLDLTDCLRTTSHSTFLLLMMGRA